METINPVEVVLNKYKKGSRKDYDNLVSKLANPTLSDASLVKCLKCLKDCATLLDSEHEALIGVLLKLEWYKRSVKVVQAYQSTMLVIVSVHTVYLKACMRSLVKIFMPMLQRVEDGSENADVTITDEIIASHNQGFTNSHALIKTILKLVPMSSNLMMPLLLENYPFYTKHAYLHECFMKNMLQITLYKPDLRQPIMELVIEKIIGMDTRVPRSHITESMTQDESQESGIFNMDEVDPVVEYTEKLDVLMVHLFEYVQSTCYKDGELDWDGTKTLYREMLYIFEKVILPTHACCHVQFIMFYLVSFRMQLCDGFLDYLWKLVQNPNVQSVYRQSAVAYMGSLLARAKFVSLKTVMKTVELMMNWAHTYTETCQDCVMADRIHHGPFYSVCQAVFYVFAFRQKEIVETKGGLKWAQTLQFQHLVQCRLNPLKICLPVVVRTFASITRQHQLAFCDHIIQQNNRSFLPVDSSSLQKTFETYFPFDPYLLKRSLKYIEPHYREYDQSMDVHDDSSGDEDEDEMFTDDISQSKPVAMVTASGSLIDKTLDLMSYGTSPGFNHL